MKAIVNTAPGTLEMLDLPLPQPRLGQVRIRTAACAICATDLVMIAGWKRTPFGAIPGHEWAGVVDAVGPGADSSLIGRKCVAENVLPSGGEVGFEHPGGYAEFFLTDAANVRTLPSDFDLVTATLIEPLAVCVRGLSRLGPPSSPLLLFGDGPIGLLTLMLLADRRVTELNVVGGRESRLKLASTLGARSTLNYHSSPDLVSAVRAASGVPSFATLIEASGSSAAMQACVDLASNDACILVLGDYGAGRASFEWNALLHRELRLIGSNASAGAWDEAVSAATSGRLPLRTLVTHVLPASGFQEGIDLMRDRRPDVMKVVMTWDQGLA